MIFCFQFGRSWEAEPAEKATALPTGVLQAGGRAAEQELENLSGLSPNPEKVIFAVHENKITCLMAEFAAKFIIPYNVWANNFIDVWLWSSYQFGIC
ncbi:UNVERIFIED_CONTAM: hypothetical protein K2H54_040288 [Gekko kuhli]